MTKFIRVFTSDKEANEFAERHHSTPFVRYDWDSFLQSFVPQYVVEF